MLTIFYYISGHGYGHTTRSIELIKALLRKNPNLFFHIRTDAPQWLFELNLDSNYRLHQIKLDVGTVQETSFHINKRKTVEEVAELYARREEIVKGEYTAAKEAGAELIIADIPPLAFDIAAAAQIPGVALANFSWDWIYQDYLQAIPEFDSLIRQVKSSYGKATLLLRLPFYGDLSAFPNIKDIPLIARKATRPKEEILKTVEIEPETRSKLVLVAFRACDLQKVDFTGIEGTDGFKFITLGLQETHQNCINIPPNLVRFPDLVNACDAVVSKPGYGLVAEILANQTPLLYTSRDDFVEYAVLANGLNKYAVVKELPLEDFFAGNWQEYLEALLEQPSIWKQIELNGAEIGADQVLKILGTK